MGAYINIMAKKIRNAYDKYLTYDNLMYAHNKSKQGKGYKKSVILFNQKKEEYILWLYEALKTGTYRHGGYNVFYITEPKLRKIEASSYIDRIVHRWYVESFLQGFIKQFIYNSYACLKNKGMHIAAKDVQRAMQKCKRKYGEYYILKMDIAHYFQNIDKNILLDILKRKIEDPKVWWLTEKILYSKKGDKGIPIGNYTSQIYANIYLNELDQYIKHNLKVKYYFRYMDDSIILLKDKEELKEILKKIKIFLKEKLKLELNTKTNIFKGKQGVNFCGYKINEYRLKIRTKGKKKLKQKIKYLKYKIKQGEMTSKEARKYLCGHIGYIDMANTYNLINRNFYEEVQ